VEWIWAGVAIVGGFIVGMVVSAIVRRIFSQRKGRTAQLAPAAASLSFSLILVIGLLVALGFVQPNSLSKLRDDTIDYLPRALSALIVVILGGVVGTIASTAARESIGRSMGRLGTQVPTLLKTLITGFAVILAASQLGIDTTIINIVVAAAVFCLALSFAMIVGIGSRPVATEISSGRALRRLVSVGDAVQLDSVTGVVVAMHQTAVEVRDDNGMTTMVPNSDLTNAGFQITRAPAKESGIDS